MMMGQVDLSFEPPPAGRSPRVRWFGPRSCVLEYPERFDIVVGGVLVGQFDRTDHGTRNLLVVQLARDPRIRRRHLARAFGITAETLRLLRNLHEEKGVEALVKRRLGNNGDRKVKLTPNVRARLMRMFDEGLGVAEGHAKFARILALRPIQAVRTEWLAARHAAPAPAEPSESTSSSTAEAPVQQELPLMGGDRVPASASTSAPAATAPAEPADAGAEEPDAAPILPARDVRGGRAVQHLGAWLLVAMLHSFGLHRLAAKHADAGKLTGGRLRLALDAAIISLAIGERSLEGVRRVATPSAPLLLRAAQPPTASWVRRTLAAFSESAAIPFQLGMAGRHIRAGSDEGDGGPAVFYVDNHLRPYRGKKVIRRGWRMQDKRALPGITDYYVHDEDGCPIMRVDVPSHDSLCAWLSPIARTLKLAVDDEPILLAFDRAGAFPEQLATLRDEGYQCVTYERRPYQRLSRKAFDRKVTLDGEELGFTDKRANLGGGRGRVRRIGVLTPDGRQVNLLAVSTLPAEDLIAIMRGRWLQENGFKHGVERWGINQLDGRKTEAYDPDTVIPNPARRRLDRRLRLARELEGAARRDLARLGADDPKRAKLEKALAEALELEKECLALRPAVPMRAPLSETELAGKLVYHRGAYKAVVDTIRIACANAESDLAATLAPHLPKPAEAKKALAALFTAPGEIRVKRGKIEVELALPGNRSEQEAHAALLGEVNGWQLTLPGDPHERRLCFRSQNQEAG
jgi:hypothetical protein